ncbi:MAG: Nif3-like dinuclear metal center hexameric protein [Chitinispirillaceae bacterium]|nr:Nif3-like dinuclear metal center hexameric protein [Chitinispirillaceae bacterium]
MINKKSIKRERLVEFLDKELKVKEIQDLSRNGLQVEGGKNVRRVALAVDACGAAYRAAAHEDCQMIIAHHGMIWGGLPCLTGNVAQQIRFLFDRGISLYAAHLPLDLHPKHGNNARIAALLGLRSRKPFGEYNGVMIGWEGVLPAAAGISVLSERLERALGGVNVVLPFGRPAIRRVGIVSGRAGDILAEAVGKDLDCFITGEPKHEQYHLAKDAHINVIYCGHYHSEKAGVQALGRLIEKRFGVTCVFLDIPTIL